MIELLFLYSILIWYGHWWQLSLCAVTNLSWVGWNFYKAGTWDGQPKAKIDWFSNDYPEESR